MRGAASRPRDATVRSRSRSPDFERSDLAWRRSIRRRMAHLCRDRVTLAKPPSAAYEGAGRETGTMTAPESIYGSSWYAATMVAAPERVPLVYDLDVDVCVIGGGL